MAQNSLSPLSESHFTVNIAGIKGMYFTKFSGVSYTVDTSVYADGQSHLKSTLTGMTKYDDVTLSVPYVSKLHDAGYAAIEEARKKGTRLTVSVTPVSSIKDLTPAGKTDTLHGCQVVSCLRYAVDRGSANASELKLVLSVDNVT